MKNLTISTENAQFTVPVDDKFDIDTICSKDWLIIDQPNNNVKCINVKHIVYFELND